MFRHISILLALIGCVDAESFQVSLERTENNGNKLIDKELYGF